MLEDKLIEGTGSPAPYAKDKDNELAGPRAYAARVRQMPCKTGTEFELAYEFIGTPVEDSYLKQMRTQYNLSENWGAVIMPKDLLPGTINNDSKCLVEITPSGYIIRGLLPTDSLKFERVIRGHLLSNEQVIWVSPERIDGIKFEIPDHKSF